jgi:hypothetical protein
MGVPATDAQHRETEHIPQTAKLHFAVLTTQPMQFTVPQQLLECFAMPCNQCAWVPW